MALTQAGVGVLDIPQHGPDGVRQRVHAHPAKGIDQAGIAPDLFETQCGEALKRGGAECRLTCPYDRDADEKNNHADKHDQPSQGIWADQIRKDRDGDIAPLRCCDDDAARDKPWQEDRVDFVGPGNAAPSRIAQHSIDEQQYEHHSQADDRDQTAAPIQ